jgi:CDP-diglyceride synthetase
VALNELTLVGVKQPWGSVNRRTPVRPGRGDLMLAVRPVQLLPRCISHVTFLRQRRRTLIIMMVLAVICALATATGIGYYVGRRAGSRPSTWKKRTSRMALGKLAISLLVLMTARRIRQSFRAERLLPGAVGIWGPRTLAPLALLRGGVARMRSY